MAFTLYERPDSRQQSSDGRTVTYLFNAAGEQSDKEVILQTRALTTRSILTVHGQLWRQDIQLDPVGYQLYLVTVPYGPRQRETGQASFSFDTTGGTVRIRSAILHGASYGPPNAVVPPNRHSGSIGVDKDGNVEGVDITVPAMKFTYTFRHPEGYVDEEYALELGRNTGRMNANKWRVFEAGEAMFFGATGSDGTNSEAEVSYTIIASENAQNTVEGGDRRLTIGNIQNIVKRGHDYLWIEFEDGTANGLATTKPKFVHVEQVYYKMDFKAVFGWEFPVEP